MYERAVVGNRNFLDDFGALLSAKCEEGIIKAPELAELCLQLLQVLKAAGDFRDNDPVAKPVVKHGIHRLKATLLRRHPELATELSQLEGNSGIER